MTYTLDQIRNIPILFIVGKGRSGTTLLSTILDSHPNIASATESRFLLILWSRYKHMKSWSPNKAKQLILDLLKDPRVNYLWEFEDGLIDNLKSLPEETRIQDIIKLIYLFRKSNFKKGEIRLIVDKNPKYTLFVDTLNTAFPEAKFFRLLRDPRDNIASQVKFSKKKVSELAYKWLKYNQLLDQFELKLEGRLLSLRFEDLVLDIENFFKSFETFSGIHSIAQYEAKRLEVKDKFEEKFDAKMKDQHQSTVKPLDPTKIGHYKKRLNQQQIADVEAICFPFAQKYKYELNHEVPSMGLFKKLEARLNYSMLTTLNRKFYNLPFWLLLIVGKVLIDNPITPKGRKLNTLKKQNPNSLLQKI